MKLEIIRKDSYNCFQNHIAAVAKYYQSDYRMMMLELWGFIYNQNKSTIGERMGLIWIGELEYRKTLLSNFHGISFVRYKSIWEIKDRMDVVKNSPIALYLDSFECDWLPFYHKQHRQHICNIIDMDELYCYCQDDYLGKDGFKSFKLDEIEKMSDNLLVFSCEVGKKIFRKEINEIIRYAVQKYDKCQCLEKMKLFVEDFSKEFDFSKEISQGNPVSSKAFMYLKGLGDDKINLIEFFEFLYDTFGTDISEVKNILNEQAKKYYSIRNYLIKMYFSKKKIDYEILSAELGTILDYECKLNMYFRSLYID